MRASIRSSGGETDWGSTAGSPLSTVAGLVPAVGTLRPVTVSGVAATAFVEGVSS